MRYINTDTIDFTDVDNVTHKITDWREIPSYQTWKNINNITEDVELDEIASRDEFFGDGAEYMNYALVEANLVKMMEADFNSKELKKIIVPVIEDII